MLCDTPWDDYPKYKVSPADPATLRHSDVTRLLDELNARHTGVARLVEVGRSFEDRPIFALAIGNGPVPVLLWSQMHGDEPTHTAVLLDLAAYLLKAGGDLNASSIRTSCTLTMVPMLNPDGAERNTRNNAQGIDINRDARALATPEGQALQALVNRLNPQFAFNLHNQDARATIYETGQPVAASVLVPPVDAMNQETESMRHAAQVAAVLVQAIGPRCHHAVARYAADYMPTAFGEWVQSQGSSTLLVEACCGFENEPENLVQLHWSGLLAALGAIATGAYAQADALVYHRLPTSNPMTESPLPSDGARESEINSC